MIRFFQPTLFAAILAAGPAAASSILVLDATDRTTPSIERIEESGAHRAGDGRATEAEKPGVAAGKDTDDATTGAIPTRLGQDADPEVIRAGEKGEPVRRVGPAPVSSANAPSPAPAGSGGPVSTVE